MTTVVKCTPKKPNWTLYIGRAWAGIPESKWHNPFHLWQCQGIADCLRKYAHYVKDTPELWNALHEIDDQVLGCWCRPHECHGDVLINLRKEQLEGIH